LTLNLGSRCKRRPMDETDLRIGEVAAQAGVETSALRFYERRGLLSSRARKASGYRVYASDDVRTVKFIRRAQDLGFTLAEVRELLELRNSRRGCREVRSVAETKLERVTEKVRHLRAMARALESLIATCGSSGERVCPILEALDT